jgi:hypothetical protein
VKLQITPHLSVESTRYTWSISTIAATVTTLADLPTLDQAVDWVDRTVRPKAHVGPEVMAAREIEVATEAGLVALFAKAGDTRESVVAPASEYDRSARELVTFGGEWSITWDLIGTGDLARTTHCPNFVVQRRGPSRRESEAKSESLWHTASVGQAFVGLWRLRSRLASGVAEWPQIAAELIATAQRVVASPPTLASRLRARRDPRPADSAQANESRPSRHPVRAVSV